jgi:hypothetical protein
MDPAPREIGGAKVICFTPIDERHQPTGHCKQIVAGLLQGPAAGLAIGCYPDAAGYYLFGCDAAWQIMTDTWHPSLEDAKSQAELEYAGVWATWNLYD